MTPNALTYDVHACGSCPLLAPDGVEEFCGHPLATDVAADSTADEPPRECPLRKVPLLVRLRVLQEST